MLRITTALILLASISQAQMPDPYAIAQDGEASTYIFKGPDTGWGVVKDSTVYYNKKGIKEQDAQVGDLFVYNKVVKIKGKGSAFYANVLRDQKPLGIFIFSAKACVAFSGSYGTLTEEQQLAITEYFKIVKAQVQIENKARATHLEKSPDGKAIARFKQAYNKSFEIAKRYKAEAKKARTNAQRMAIMDKQRELKGTQSAIKIKITELQKQSEKWLKTHPFSIKAVQQLPAYKSLEVKRLDLKKTLPINLD